MPGFSNLSLPRWPEEDAPLALPPGFHPDGVLGGLNLSTSQPKPVHATEISQPILNLADSSFRIPALPPDALAGMFIPSDMTASPRLVEFLKSYEKSPTGGPGLKPYRSPERGSDTVGWGHKILPGEDYSHGLTVAEADQLFLKDLARHQRLVQERVKVPLTQQQFDAMVSLAYNLPAAFNSGPQNPSTLLSKLNEGNYTGAADQLPRWDRGGPKKERMPGLTERRGYERDMFLNGVYTNHK